MFKMNKPVVAMKAMPMARRSSTASASTVTEMELDIHKSYTMASIVKHSDTSSSVSLRIATLEAENANMCAVIDDLMINEAALKQELAASKSREAFLEVKVALQAADLKWARAAFALACEKAGVSATEIYNEVLPTLDITCPDHDVNNPDYEANKALPPITTGPGAAVLAPPFLAPLAEVVPCPAAACAAPLAAPLASPKALLSPPACMAAEAAVEKEVPAVEEVAVAEVQGAKPIMSRVDTTRALGKSARKAKPDWFAPLEEKRLDLVEEWDRLKSNFTVKSDIVVAPDTFSSVSFAERSFLPAGAAAAAPAASLSPRGGSSVSLGSERSCGSFSQSSWSSVTSAYDLSDRVSLCGGDYDGFGCGKTRPIRRESGVGALSCIGSSSARLSWGGSSVSSCGGSAALTASVLDADRCLVSRDHLDTDQAREMLERFVVEAKARPDMLRRGGDALSLAKAKTAADAPLNSSSSTKDTRDQVPNAFKENATKATAGALGSISGSNKGKGKAAKSATGQTADAPKKPVSPATAKALARKAASAGGAASAVGPAASAKGAVRGSKGVSQPSGWRK